jgi:hypothetical protein
MYITIITSFIIIIFCYKNYTHDDVGIYKKTDLTKWTNEWLYTDQNGDKQSIQIPTNLDVKKGETTEISRTLPEEFVTEPTIIFRTDHSFVRVYAGEDMIYSFGNQDELPFGKTPGSIWNIVQIPPGYENCILTIQITCPYEKYSGQIRDVIYGTSNNTTLYIFRDSFPLFLTSFVAFILGSFLIILFLLLLFKQRSLDIFNIGLFLIITSLWGFSESRFFQFFFNNAFSVEISTFLFFSMTFMAAAIALKEIGVIKSTKVFYLCFLWDFIVYLTINICQFLNLADYFDTCF